MSTQAPILQHVQTARERAQLGTHADRGSGWFYWIAGLSLVNSILIQSGGSWSFVFGLGLTAGVDYLAQNAAGLGQLLAWAFNAAVIGAFVVFGHSARKGHRWAYLIGLTVYAADTLLVLASKDWLAVAVHVFGLLCILNGLSALNRRQLQQSSAGA
jgi:hypothetical protein